MPRTHWYDPLLSFLAEQPPGTTSVMLTVAELTTLVGSRLPMRAMTRSCWHIHKDEEASAHVVAVGWRVASMHGRPLVLTFERQQPDTTA